MLGDKEGRGEMKKERTWAVFIEKIIKYWCVCHRSIAFGKEEKHEIWKEGKVGGRVQKRKIKGK